VAAVHFRAVLGDEIRALPLRMGGVSGLLLFAFIVVAFGIYVPWRWGFEFLNPMVLIAYAGVAMLFTGPVAAESFAAIHHLAADRPEVRRDALWAKLLCSAAYGAGATTLLLAAGLATVHTGNWRGGPLLPEEAFLASLLLFTWSIALAVASLAARIGVVCSALSTKRILRSGFLLLVLLALMGLRHGPEEWRTRLALELTAERFPRLALIVCLHLLFVSALLVRSAAGRLEEIARGTDSPLGLRS